MDAGEWILQGDILTVRSADQSALTPSAEDIFRMGVEGEVVAPLPPIRDYAKRHALSFSRYPVVLELRIESIKSGDRHDLRASAIAKSDRDLVEFELGDALSRRADHVVRGRRWYPIAPGALEELKQIAKDASIAVLGVLTLRQYLDLIRMSGNHPMIVNRAAELTVPAKLDAPQLPSGTGFVGALYPYQEVGVRWLAFMSDQGVGGILADEMGLGKTVQIAALLASEQNQGRKPSLVVATGTLLENWRRELCKFVPGIRTSIHRGSQRSAFPQDLREPDVTITSYDTLIRDLPIFRQIDWNLVVLDEAQAIKNPTTRRAQSVKRLPRRTSIAVTGTPVENRLTDLWSITDFVLPGFLGSLPDFERNYENNEDSAALLASVVSPVLLRRRVAEVASDLPPKIEIPVVLELELAQAQSYEQIRLATLAEYGASAGLVALTRLRMYCAHPQLISPAARDLAVDSPKYQRLLEIVEELLANGQKALVFTSFNEMTDLMRGDLRSRFSAPVAFIDGRTKIEERQGVVDLFSETKGGSILILNPRAAGTGLNITAANHVIHYNLEWNPAVEDQATARAYRRGQSLPVTVHRLFYGQTVEEVVNDRLSRKRTLAANAVVGTDGSDETMADIASALAKSPISAARS